MRRGAHKLFKGCGKITAIIETARKCNVGYGVLAVNKHFFGIFYFDKRDVFGDAKPCDLLEFS